jgi:hypothetical protein
MLLVTAATRKSALVRPSSWTVRMASLRWLGSEGDDATASSNGICTVIAAIATPWQDVFRTDWHVSVSIALRIGAATEAGIAL